MTGIPQDISIEAIEDVDFSRRSFLQAGAGGVAAGLMLPLAQEALNMRSVNAPTNTDQWGVALAYGQGRLDLIDLDQSKLLHSFGGLRATHAITPVEHLNRFVVHGRDTNSGQGAVGVLEVDPDKKTWDVVLYTTLPGGTALHWQPNPEFTEIVFNTIGDGSLHVLDTDKLTIKRFDGGGGHSNMAFFNDYLVATDEMSGPTKLNVVDRKTGKLLSTTPVGTWGHGLTVCQETAQAFVWSNEGVQVVSLASKTLGNHLDTINPDSQERCWFCWTPQGGQYTHDVAWMPGDEYLPQLTVIDMKNNQFEAIPTGDPELQPSYLQLSPDGKWGLASMKGRTEIGVFDTVTNQFKGTVEAGPALPGFFERDMSFCRNRDCAIVTNTGDNSISLLDLKRKLEIRRISLPRRPLWLKVISPA